MLQDPLLPFSSILLFCISLNLQEPSDMAEGNVFNSTAVRAVELSEHLHIMQPQRVHEWGQNSQQQVDEVHYKQYHYTSDCRHHRRTLCAWSAQHLHYDLESKLISSKGKANRC